MAVSPARRARRPTAPPVATQPGAHEIVPPPPDHLRRLLLTVDDMAEVLRISKAKAWRLIGGDAPAIPSVMVIGSRRIRVSDLEAYVASLR